MVFKKFRWLVTRSLQQSWTWNGFGRMTDLLFRYWLQNVHGVKVWSYFTWKNRSYTRPDRVRELMCDLGKLDVFAIALHIIPFQCVCNGLDWVKVVCISAGLVWVWLHILMDWTGFGLEKRPTSNSVSSIAGWVLNQPGQWSDKIDKMFEKITFIFSNINIVENSSATGYYVNLTYFLTAIRRPVARTSLSLMRHLRSF